MCRCRLDCDDVPCQTHTFEGLKQAIRDVLVDEDNHYRMDLSGADVIQDLTTIAQEWNCCDGATEPGEDAPDGITDDRVRQGLGLPNWSEAEPAGLDDPMEWER